MGFSLNKDEIRQREMMSADLEKMEVRLSAVIAQFNATMKAAWESVERVQEAYNLRVRDVQGFVETIHKKYSEEFDAKPEDWQDDEKGEVVSDWLAEWSIVLDESDLEIPEDVELVGSATSEELDNLPSEPMAT